MLIEISKYNDKSKIDLVVEGIPRTDSQLAYVLSGVARLLESSSIVRLGTLPEFQNIAEAEDRQVSVFGGIYMATSGSVIRIFALLPGVPFRRRYILFKAPIDLDGSKLNALNGKMSTEKIKVLHENCFPITDPKDNEPCHIVFVDSLLPGSAQLLEHPIKFNTPIEKWYCASPLIMNQPRVSNEQTTFDTTIVFSGAYASMAKADDRGVNNISTPAQCGVGRHVDGNLFSLHRMTNGSRIFYGVPAFKNIFAEGRVCLGSVDLPGQYRFPGFLDMFLYTWRTFITNEGNLDLGSAITDAMNTMLVKDTAPSNVIQAIKSNTVLIAEPQAYSLAAFNAGPEIKPGYTTATRELMELFQ